MTQTILVVDDETELVQAMQIRLQQAGYGVLCAYDGQAALDKVHEENPDLVILDLMLPRIDGYEVCRMLKLDEKYKKIPVIMLTAKAQEPDEKLGHEAGADAYITKPFEHEAVLANIKELLGD